jgi:hypothetical protein
MLCVADFLMAATFDLICYLTFMRGQESHGDYLFPHAVVGWEKKLSRRMHAYSPQSTCVGVEWNEI